MHTPEESILIPSFSGVVKITRTCESQLIKVEGVRLLVWDGLHIPLTKYDYNFYSLYDLRVVFGTTFRLDKYDRCLFYLPSNSLSCSLDDKALRFDPTSSLPISNNSIG